MRLRSFIRCFIVTSLLSVAACTAPANDDATSSSEAITRCGPGYELDPGNGEGSNGGSRATCVPVGIVAATMTPVSRSVLIGRGFSPDTCGVPNAVPVPPVLEGLGCTPGINVDGQNIWACPSGAAIPMTPIGTAPTKQRCYDDLGNKNHDVDYLLGPCEATLVFHDLLSNCLGSAAPGYELVIDAALPVHVCPSPTASWTPPAPRVIADPPRPPIDFFPEPGSCSGGCAVSMGPPLAN